jgi:hypothetical protein
MPTPDELAEQAGRMHADRVGALLGEFPQEDWQDVLAVGIAAARFVAILREGSSVPDEGRNRGIFWERKQGIFGKDQGIFSSEQQRRWPRQSKWPLTGAVKFSEATTIRRLRTCR